ncbi:hypothetical protein ABIC28_005102 [Rhodococcus sp. PvR044]|uniref:hypothetical protein n=1 Tax=Rhodococcus sp. PvR044 TaxID=3156402 RepID=UPI00339898F5
MSNSTAAEYITPDCTVPVAEIIACYGGDYNDGRFVDVVLVNGQEVLGANANDVNVGDVMRGGLVTAA